MLADAQTGYTWGWKLYTGKEGDRGDKGLAHGVVLELVDAERVQDKGYVVVTDNFYSSPALFCDLQQRGFGACGTTKRDTCIHIHACNVNAYTYTHVPYMHTRTRM